MHGTLGDLQLQYKVECSSIEVFVFTDGYDVPVNNKTSEVITFFLGVKATGAEWLGSTDIFARVFIICAGS